MESAQTPLSNEALNAATEQAQTINEFAHENEIFKQLVGGQSSDTFPLPIATKNDPTFFDEILNRIREFLAALFPSNEETESWTWLAQLIQFLAQNWAWVFAVIVISLGLFLSYHVYRNLRSKKILKTSGAPRNIEQFSKIELDLKEALLKKDFPKAAKLRWKLFLIQKNYPSSLTPYEYSGQSSENSTPQHEGLKNELAWIYDLMFARQEKPSYEEAFKKLHTLLFSIDKKESI